MGWYTERPIVFTSSYMACTFDTSVNNSNADGDLALKPPTDGSICQNTQNPTANKTNVLLTSGTFCNLALKIFFSTNSVPIVASAKNDAYGCVSTNMI